MLGVWIGVGIVAFFAVCMIGGFAALVGSRSGSRTHRSGRSRGSRGSSWLDWLDGGSGDGGSGCGGGCGSSS